MLQDAIGTLAPEAIAVELTAADLAERRPQTVKREYPEAVYPLLDAGGIEAIALEPDQPGYGELVGRFREGQRALAEQHPGWAEAFGIGALGVALPADASPMEACLAHAEGMRDLASRGMARTTVASKAASAGSATPRCAVVSFMLSEQGMPGSLTVEAATSASMERLARRFVLESKYSSGGVERVVLVVELQP